jgi:hypothetical protein
VERDIGSEGERLLEIRGRKGVVDDDESPRRMGRGRRCLDVDDVEQRIRR